MKLVPCWHVPVMIDLGLNDTEHNDGPHTLTLMGRRDHSKAGATWHASSQLRGAALAIRNQQPHQRIRKIAVPSSTGAFTYYGLVVR
jgi:hypothetical protein